MSNWQLLITCILGIISASMLWVLFVIAGMSLIRFYFRQKEEFLNRISKEEENEEQGEFQIH